jgi:hypothetical protein
MFAASVECLLNNLLSRICLVRFFTHNELKMSKTITLKHKFHPYHLEIHQDLYGNDFQNRIHFSGTILNLVNNDWCFMHTILFSDEATFKSNGSVNRHNMHYYATGNPH